MTMTMREALDYYDPDGRAKRLVADARAALDDRDDQAARAIGALCDAVEALAETVANAGHNAPSGVENDGQQSTLIIRDNADAI